MRGKNKICSYNISISIYFCFRFAYFFPFVLQVKENEILSGLTISEASFSVLEQGTCTENHEVNDQCCYNAGEPQYNSLGMHS